MPEGKAKTSVPFGMLLPVEMVGVYVLPVEAVGVREKL